jgi:dolichol-phosphate mannosyltransferase
VAHRPRLRGTSKYRILDRLVVGISDVFGVIWLLRRAPRQGAVTEVTAGKKTARKAAKKVAKKASKTASNKGVGA